MFKIITLRGYHQSMDAALMTLHDVATKFNNVSRVPGGEVAACLLGHENQVRAATHA